MFRSVRQASIRQFTMARFGIEIVGRSLRRVALVSSVVSLGAIALPQRALAVNEDSLQELTEGGSTGLESSTTATSATSFKTILTDVKENVRTSFFNFATAPMRQANEGEARINNYSYIAVDYRLGKGRKLSVRPVFQWGTNGRTDRGEYEATTGYLGDAYIVYDHKNVALLPGDIDFDAQMRVYLPTSEKGQSTGMITRLRPELTFSRKLSTNWLAELIVEPDYYFQDRTASVDERGKVLTNRNYGYESSLGLSYRVNRTIALSGAVTHEQMWHHSSITNHVPGRDRNNEVYRTEAAGIELGVGWSLGPVFLITGIEQKRDVARPRNDYAFFRLDESSYYLLSHIRF